MRILLSLIIVCALFMTPFFVPCFLAFVGLVYFPRYVEFIFIALLTDLVYRGDGIYMLGMIIPLTVFALIIFAFAEYLKMFVRTRMI